MSAPRVARPRVPPALALAIYLASIPIAGAVLGPPVHAAIGAGVEFNQLVFRLMELWALLSLWALLAALGGNDRAAWGFAPAPAGRGFGAGLGLGLLGGAAMLAGVVAVLLAAGARVPAPDAAWSAGTVGAIAGKAIVGGLIVSLIEELWFRGALWCALERAWGVRIAIAATSILYALVHFVRPDVVVDPAEAGWIAGFEVVAGSFSRFTDPRIVDSLAALAAAGVLLGVVRARTGRIAECIGIHAGWVAVIYVSRKTTVLDADAGASVLVGGYDGVIGWLVAAWFAALALACRRVPERSR